MINPLGIITTAVIYKIVETFKHYPILKSLPPILVSGIAIIFFLNFFNIDYSVYQESVLYLTLLLIPATISLGYSLYKNISMLYKNKRIIYCAFFLASLCTILLTYLIAKLCHADNSTILSMLPKSVTAPIAIEISKTLGGIQEITICTVVLTGIFGALVGHKILSICGVKNPIAIGLSIGAASHIIGTSKCIEKGNEKEIVMSTLGLVIVGIITAIITPILLFILK